MKRLPLSIAASALIVAFLVPLASSTSSAQGRIGAAAAQRAPELAQVRYIYHGLSVQPPGQQSQRGKAKMPLFQQYALRTAQDEKASIGFHDGTVLHMNQRTDAVLASPNVTRVMRGEVAEYLAPGTNHQIQTATAVAAAIGTTYDVRTDGATSTFVVLHGALQVTNRSGGVVVKSNRETVVAPNAAPQPPSPVDAKAVFAWTNGIPTPDLGEDVALDANGGSVVAYSSQRQGAGDRGHVQHINDGLLSEGWESADGQVKNQWVKVGFLGGNFYRIAGVIIDPAATYGDSPSEDLKDFEIRVSSSGTDEGSFTTVFQGRCKQTNALQNFTFPVPVRARYAELVALSNYGSPQRVAVAEWEVVASTSLFAQPSAVATDRQGNVYVADTNSNRIDKLSPRGKEIAHWGKKGRNLGEFLRPQGLTLDHLGNIYIADTYNHRIQKLSPKGRVLASWGSSGVGDGQFLFPRGIAVDGFGNVYVTDVDNRVQKFSSGGKVLAVWRDLSATDHLNFPEGIALDRHGNLLVADTDNNRIVKLSPTGRLLAAYGTPGSGVGQLSAPTSVAVDGQGNIYVADAYNARIQKIDTSGKFSVWGKAGFAPGQFFLPLGVTIDSHDNVFVADTGNSRIQKFSTAGKVRAVWGKYATVPQVLGEPAGIAVDQRGNVYVTDDLNDRIQQRSPGGQVQAVYGYHGFVAAERGKGLGQFWYPHGIAINRQGAIYVADSFNHRIQILSNRGPIGALGKKGSAPGQFLVPEGVALDNKGNIYVADSGNDRVQKLSPTGKVVWVVGKAGTGPGQFKLPTGIAVDQAGNVYVSELLGGRVQKLSPDGKVLDVWGDASQATTGTGRFFAPAGLAVDKQGNIYVADSGHNAIQKLSPTGRVLDVFELPGSNASPVSVAIDARGNLYVAESLSSRIVKLAPTGEVLAIWD